MAESSSPVTPPPLPRRTVLAGAIAFMGGAQAVAGQPLNPTRIGDDPALKALDALIAEVKAAITREMRLEGEPGYEQAIEDAQSLERKLEACADDILAREPSSLRDLALRARLVEYWNDRCADFHTNQDRATNELVRAVLVTCGLTPIPSHRRVVRTIAEFIAACGGRHVVADYTGVTQRTVVKWERDDFLPPGWEYRLAKIAHKRGYTLDAELFGPERPSFNWKPPCS